MNKKKQITLVLFICIIAVVSFTSYAIYQKNKKNTPDTNDLTKLAILVDGVKADTFPTKNSGKSFLKAECTNGGRTSWDKENWKLSIKDISGPTECTVSFGTLYADNSGAEQPELNNGLIPVMWNGTDWVKADTSTKWYDYNAQWWANAVTVSASTRSTYTSAAVNTPISMDDIETMWVWIPRYEYQHTNLGNQYAGGTKDLPGAISINFISKETTAPSSDNFTIHDAFWWDDNNNGIRDVGELLSGIWVAKFEMSSADATCKSSVTATNCNKLQAINIKPNVTSWRSAQIGTMWTAIHQYMNGTNNQYGLTNTDAHLMKNMEWGAVAYLSQSKYGKYGNVSYTGANKEIYQNKSSSFITGSSNGTPSQEATNTQVAYNVEGSGTGASTTGNIYGIYDMSGGTTEQVMGIQKVNGSNEPAVGYSASYNSGWSGMLGNGTAYTGTYDRLGDDPSTTEEVEGIGEKYYDLYDYDTNYGSIARYHKGDATYETLGWYSDADSFVGYAQVFLYRGGGYNSGTTTGAFFTNMARGAAYGNVSGRPTLVPLN